MAASLRHAIGRRVMARSGARAALSTNTKSRLAFVALGSNVGNRQQQLCAAWRRVQDTLGRVVATSPLYETAAAYVTDQPSFLNAVVAVETALPPLQALAKLKAAERDLGRQVRYRNGPREVDLDLLYLGDEQFHGDALTLPHPRIHERDFVLRPLRACRSQIAAGAYGLVDAALKKRWGAEYLSEDIDGEERRVWSSLGAMVETGHKTSVMGVLNCTPDSFSDGGVNVDVDAALRSAEAMIENGVDYLDVGGESTRPGSTPPSLNEELDRVLPLVERLTQFKVPVSVDTRRSEVALAARDAGAACTNDVSGGAYDADMLRALADDDQQRGVVLMHMRGEPGTMNQLASYEDVVAEVSVELRERVTAALDAGICPWRVVVDPGIGFAKNTEHNVALLRNLAQFKRNLGNLPVLIGASRKRFLGELAGEADASKRDAATAGACVACAPHADVVRVHDVRTAVQALKVADAILR